MLRTTRIVAVVASALVALLIAHDCAAWGAQGHRIIGQIAWAYLTPEAKAGVHSILGEEPLGAAGTWADEVRSDHAYDWIKPLHFVNVAKDAEAVDMTRDCPNGECVVEAIRRYRARAMDTSLQQADRLMAMRLLIHFVGDVHQPLHVSYAEDRGGNKRSLKFMGKRSNFHKVWDSDIIEQRIGNTDWQVWGNELIGRISPDLFSMMDHSHDPLAWANQTLSLTRHLYRDLDSDELGDDYYKMNLPLLEEQLQTAGVRLAGMLNAMFAPPPASHPATTMPAVRDP